MCVFEQTTVEQVNHPAVRCDASCLRTPDQFPRLVVPIFCRPGRVLRRQLNHAVVRQDHLGAIRDKKLFIDVDPPGRAALPISLRKASGSSNHAVPNNCTAVRTQNPARGPTVE